MLIRPHLDRILIAILGVKVVKELKTLVIWTTVEGAGL